jgi:DME family drug/metabolite transporter
MRRRFINPPISLRFDTVVMSGTSTSSPATTVGRGSDDEPSPPVAPGPDRAVIVRALLLGLLAAVTYSVANMALRGLSRTDGGPGWDMWVAGTKAFPTFAVAVVLLAMRKLKGETTFAAWDVVWPIAVAALFNQLGGNFGFQMSLRAIGLAISVPICFSSIICSGAIVGRIVLNDQVSIRTGISMALMIASIAFLSTAAKSRAVEPTVIDAVSVVSEESDDATSSLAETAKPAPLSVAAGVALSMISGLCYGVTGVFIRKAVRSQMPVAATLFLFSAAGFLVLCPLSLLMLPVQTIAETSTNEWLTIATAGIFNAIGFYAITHAMRYLTISRANIINASQNAMCAVGAVVVFDETLNLIGVIGISLTIAGLLVLDRR